MSSEAQMRESLASIKHAIEYAEYLDNSYCESPIELRHLKAVYEKASLPSMTREELVSTIENVAFFGTDEACAKEVATVLIATGCVNVRGK